MATEAPPESAGPGPLPNPEPPERLLDLRRSAPSEAAAGAEAVVSAVRHVLSEMDPVRGAKALFALNQHGGTDCPGCAWPDPDDERSRLGEYCENGAKAIAEEATSKRLDAAFFAAHSCAELAELNDYEIGKKGRVAQPLVLRAGSTHYEPIGWDAAFALIADRLRALDSPDRALFYTSGRTSNEAAFLYQLLVRAYGTNNLPDCSNMCHESSGVALGESLGIGKGSVTLEDFYEAEAIVILGQNPGTNHPRMLSALQRAKANGAVILSVNPLKEAGLVAFKNPQQLSGALGRKTALTDLYVQVRINGDLALLQAWGHLLLAAEAAHPGTVLDPDFIAAHTEGFAAWRDHLSGLDLAALIAESGAPADAVHRGFELLRDRKKIIACWAMGLTQHRNAVVTIQEVVNLLLAKGSIGKPGAGTCPVRGHSNVQGDRTMGIYEKPSAAFLDRLEARYGFAMPRTHGLDVVDGIRAMHEGRIGVFFAMGGNFLSASPDTHYTAEALRRTGLTVHVSTKLNRSHLITGTEALILPCLARTDRDETGGSPQFVTTENSMGVVQASRGNLRPVSGDLLSEPAIVCRLAQALFPPDSPGASVPWAAYLGHYDRIRDDIERVIPGFEQYNERARERGGFYLPNTARANAYPTPTGRARFTLAQVEPLALAPGELVMMSLRSHDQFNTTIYGLDDRYRGIRSERRVLFLHPDDAAERGLVEGDVVDLVNTHGGIRRVARTFLVVPYDIPLRCCATYYPEANVLVPIDSVAEKSNTPTSKFVVIQLEKQEKSGPPDGDPDAD